ncbi:MAG: hypothetical protein ACRDYA_03505 [Egibacteraceae bacterium]
MIEHTPAVLGARPLDGRVDDATLACRIERLRRVETITAAQKLRYVAEIDARGPWWAEGARSTADLLAQRLRLTRGEARAQTDTAIGWRGCRIPPRRSVKARLASGRHRSRLRRQRSCALTCATGSTSSSLPTVAVWTAANSASTSTRGHTVDPDALAGRERRAWATRRLSITAEGPDGVVRGGFELDPVGVATLMTA